MNKPTKPTLATDRIVKIGMGLYLVVILSYLVPIFIYETPSTYSRLYFDLPLLLMVIVSIQYRLQQVKDRSEKRFWNLWSLGLCAWLAQVVLVSVTNSESIRSVDIEIASSSLFFLFYTALALGLESQPHLSTEHVGSRLRVLNWLGVFIFFLGLLLYFVIVPRLLMPDSYRRSSWVFYAVFDLYLLVRLAGFVRTAADRRWRHIYAWLLVAPLLWLCSDTLSLVMLIGGSSPTGLFAPLLLASFSFILIAARSRELSWDDEVDTKPRMAPRSSGQLGPLIFYATMFPLIHFGIARTRLFDATLAPIRETLVLIFLVLLIFLVYIYQRLLETENRRLQDKQQKSHVLYTHAEQVAKMGHWEWDVVTDRMINCSEQYAKILGITLEQILEPAISYEKELEFVREDDRKRYMQVIEEAYERKERWDIEYRVITSAGKMAYVHELGEPVLDEHSNLVRVFGTLQDITERVLADEALQQSHTLYSQAEEMGKLGHWEWDSINKKMITCSEQFAKILGMSVDETLAYFSCLENDRGVIHPDDLERYLHTGYFTVDGTSRFDIEYRIITPAGDLRHVHEQSQVILDDKDNHIKSFGTIQDITERVEAEAALQRSHALFNQAEEIGKLGHWEWDTKNNKMISCSKQFAKIYGMTVDDAHECFTGLNHDAEVVHPDDLKRYLQHNREFLDQHKGVDIEYRIITPAGEERHIHEVSELVFNDIGEVVRSFGTTQDITERVLVEEELQRSHALFAQAEKIGKMGHWEWDKISDRMISCSEQYAKIVGATVEEILEKSVGIEHEIRLIHEDDRKRYRQVTVTAYERKEAWDIEYRMNTKQGKLIYVHQLGEPEIDEHGTMIRSFGTLQDVTERKQIEERLSYQASHDALTGLINRREFEKRVQRLLSTIKQDKNEHALCFMDLDQFKIVNDTCGHAAGDEMLRQLGSVLTETVQDRDTVARLGGDEFGVLLEHCSLEDAERVATSLQKAVQDYKFIWEERNFKVGVSIGLVPITPVTSSFTELLKHADAACYIAKDAGRNRIHVYDTEDLEIALRHGEMQWATRINQTLEEDRFCLYAQPIVPINGDGDAGKHYELLIRMKDEHDNITLPGIFLPAAERYNLIDKIDRWVVEHAFRALEAHPAFVRQIHFVSINLSGQSLADAPFLEYVVKQLQDKDIDGRKICFEITETAAISNLSKAIMFISALKRLGCRFALDDFGSGLSSFGYLKNLSVDYLKIDGMFVKGMVDDPIDYAMVKSINDIGQVMGIQTIAEFVENDAIMRMLSEIGVSYAQGYSVGKPQPLDELLGRSTNIIDKKGKK